MVKLSLGSWLGSSSNSRSDAERKKEHRRTFSGFGTISPFSNKTNRMSNGVNLNPASVAGAVNGKAVGRSSTSTTASDTVIAVGAEHNENDSSNTNKTSMTALAETISRETAKLEKYMRDNGLSLPTFDVDAADDFPRLPDDIQRSRLEIVYATKQLRDLTVGPRESVRWGVWDVSGGGGPIKPHGI